MLCRHATSFRISVNNTIALDVSHVVDSVVNGGSEGQGQKQVLDASKSYQVYSYSAIPILNRRDVSNFVHHLTMFKERTKLLRHFFWKLRHLPLKINTPYFFSILHVNNTCNSHVRNNFSKGNFENPIDKFLKIL